MIAREYRFPLNGSTLAPDLPLLDVDEVSLRFGGLQALAGVSLQVRQGEIHAIIGPNGAGKSSLLNCMSAGVPTAARPGHPAPRGRAGPAHRPGTAPDRAPRRGPLVPEHRAVRHLTVLENLLLGRHLRMSTALLAGAATGTAGTPARRSPARFVEEIIDLLELEAVRHQPVGTLAYGCRSGSSSAERWLAAEPSAPRRADGGHERRGEGGHGPLHPGPQRERGTAVVMIEHDMGVVMDISERVTVLDFGEMIAEGTPDEVRARPGVIRTPTSASRMSRAA